MSCPISTNTGVPPTLDTAVAVAKALEPYNLFFLEEPLPYTDPWGYSELARQSKIRIAGGESLTGDYEWRVFAERDCFDICQPDASFTGGLSQFMRVSKMLEKAAPIDYEIVYLEGEPEP